MAAAGARAPPPLTAQGPPPSWSSAPAAKTASLRDRLQRDADHEVAAPPRPAAAPPRSVQAKPVDRPAVQVRTPAFLVSIMQLRPKVGCLQVCVLEPEVIVVVQVNPGCVARLLGYPFLGQPGESSAACGRQLEYAPLS